MTLVTVSGFPGSGTTTVVGILKGILGLPAFNIGDVFRALAAEKGLSLVALHRLARTDRSIDRALDDKQVEIARRGRVILEGRLAGFLTHRAGIPGVRVWLEAPFPMRTARVARREGLEAARAAEEIRAREDAERTRYLDFYGFDLADLTIYDLVIDTGTMPADAVAASIAAETGKRDAGASGAGPGADDDPLGRGGA